MATLNNAPFMLRGTCKPGASSIPAQIPAIGLSTVFMHFDGIHIPPFLDPDAERQDYYGRQLLKAGSGQMIVSPVKTVGDNALVFIDNASIYVNSVNQSSTLPGNAYTIESLAHMTTINRGFRIRDNGNNTIAYIASDGVTFHTKTGTFILPESVKNRWTHIALQQSGSGYTIYVNATPCLSSTDTTQPRFFYPNYGWPYKFGYARAHSNLPAIGDLFNDAAKWLAKFGLSF